MSTSTFDPSVLDGGAGPAPVLDLARRLHDTVAQRLAGLSYLLAADRELSAEATDRCRVEVEAALVEMRDALSSVATPALAGAPAAGVLEEEVRALLGSAPGLEFDWAPEDHAGIGRAGLVEGFLAEAIRNVRKHSRPTEVTVSVVRHGGAVVVEVVNDGVSPRRGGSCGVGRRLLEVEASLHGALVESGPADPGHWAMRLILSEG